MYYRVLRKLIRYILAMCMIIGGFSCGLIIIAWSNGKNGFQFPFKSFVVTLTMAMGEFETVERYEDFKQDEEEEIGRTFAMILIIFMIILLIIADDDDSDQSWCPAGADVRAVGSCTSTSSSLVPPTSSLLLQTFISRSFSPSSPS